MKVPVDAGDSLDLLKQAITGGCVAGDSGDSGGETMIGLERLNAIGGSIATALAEDIPGDLMEAGAWRGGVAIFMRAVLDAWGDTARLVLVADSFAGMPRSDHPQDAAAADYLVGAGSLAVTEADVRAGFARYGLLDDRVVMIPGWFSETLPGVPGPVAVLHIDCDLYQSTTEVLTAMYPKVPPGGFVIVDDYGAMPFCHAAVDDFREQHAVPGGLQSTGATAVWWRAA